MELQTAQKELETTEDVQHLLDELAAACTLARIDRGISRGRYESVEKAVQFSELPSEWAYKLENAELSLTEFTHENMVRLAITSYHKVLYEYECGPLIRRLVAMNSESST